MVLKTISNFSGIHEGQAIPQDYIVKNQAAITKQVVVGGYRLAYLIEQIFANQSMDSAFLQ